jgi:polyhydroxyalkanoate synthesis regulator phasin
MMEVRSMRKVVVAGVSAFSIAAGSAAVAFVVPGGIAGAQDSGETTSTPSVKPRGGKALDAALAALVDAGTLTESQAAAVKAKIAETAKAGISKKLDAAKQKFGVALDEIAAFLGTDAATLREQLRTTSLGEIAGEKKAGLVALLADKANARIDEAVARGALTAEKADAMKAKTAARIAQMVDAVGGKPAGARGLMGGRPGGRPGGH